MECTIKKPLVLSIWKLLTRKKWIQETHYVLISLSNSNRKHTWYRETDLGLGARGTDWQNKDEDLTQVLCRRFLYNIIYEIIAVINMYLLFLCFYRYLLWWYIFMVIFNIYIYIYLFIYLFILIVFIYETIYFVNQRKMMWHDSFFFFFLEY